MQASPKHLLAVLFLALAAAGGTSSCVVPLATGDQNCVSYCTLLQGCATNGAPTGDCSAWCSAFADVLKKTGCQAQFDDATACVAGDGTCFASSCGDQTAAYTTCASDYCTKNPTDSACVSGS